MPTGPQRTEAGHARQRAKQACRECNARRVRCNVTETHPCSNCRSAGVTCEILPSRRGRYPRKSRNQPADNATSSRTTHHDPAIPATTPASRHAIFSPVNEDPSPNHRNPDVPANHRPTPSIPRTTSPPRGSASSFFFGESNLLTCVPRLAPASQRNQNSGFSYPGMFSTPPTESLNVDPASARTECYLRDEGALVVPTLESCLPALRAYFTWFHPCFPVVDRADIASRLVTKDISPLLFHAMLFIAATYCDERTVVSMGFKDRFEAKSTFYNRARLLFDADWERDQLTVLQALFLMSFWRGGPSNRRDVRYWLGVTTTLAQTFGLHRSTRFTTKDPRVAGLRRRIWWSIYVRERQAAASLGLPSRIRDEDCDVEMLAPSDLEHDADNSHETAFGTCQPEHVVYAIKMVEIAQLLGRIIDVHFVPGGLPSTRENGQPLKDLLEKWRSSLPDNMRNTLEPEQSSIWACLLHLAYNHLSILIHRGEFLRNREGSEKQAALNAASKISRLSEDMLTQNTIQFGQMHLITSLFAALCIHVVDIRTAEGVSKKLAENRAQMCLLGLKEIQNYWSINNVVLDLFFQYLDDSTVRRLHGDQTHSGQPQSHAVPQEDGTSTANTAVPAADSPCTTGTPSIQPQQEAIEPDLYLNLFGTVWDNGDASMLDLGLLFDPHQQANSPVQIGGMQYLERCL